MNIFNLFLCVSLGAAATISQPSGKFGVSMSSTKLIDTSRTETYAPDAQDRAVMISLFYPSGSAKRCNAQMIPYMPPATAAFQDQLYSVSQWIPIKIETYFANIVNNQETNFFAGIRYT